MLWRFFVSRIKIESTLLLWKFNNGRSKFPLLSIFNVNKSLLSRHCSIQSIVYVNFHFDYNKNENFSSTSILREVVICVTNVMSIQVGCVLTYMCINDTSVDLLFFLLFVDSGLKKWCVLKMLRWIKIIFILKVELYL